MEARETFAERVERSHRYHYPGYVERWSRMDDDERAEMIQGLVLRHGEHFAPDPLILGWLLERAGIRLA